MEESRSLYTADLAQQQDPGPDWQQKPVDFYIVSPFNSISLVLWIVQVDFANCHFRGPKFLITWSTKQPSNRHRDQVAFTNPIPALPPGKIQPTRKSFGNYWYYPWEDPCWSTGWLQLPIFTTVFRPATTKKQNGVCAEVLLFGRDEKKRLGVLIWCQSHYTKA